MSPKLNEQSNEQIQAAVMEKDPITELFEVSNKHLQNLETKIWDFLKEHGIIADNSDQAISDKIKSYDGKIEWDTNNFEKIKTLKQTLDKEKKDIIKHHLVMKMISHTMVANSKDNLDLLEILKANDKKELFADVVKIKNQELTEYRKELYQIDQKYKKDIWYVEPKSREQNIADISSSLEWSIKKLAKNPDDNSAIEEFESSIQKSKELWVDKEVSEKLGKYLELSMQSWVLPLALMANWTLRKALPMLPSVIWVWVWARLMHGTMSDKASALWETALAIAPITGTYIAYEDAMKAEWTAEKVAAWTWFAVSAWFDAFSVFLVATWIGAPAAVWTQALKVTAKEAVKAWVKKLFSFFTKEAVEKTVKKTAKESPSLINVTKEFFKWKINIVKDAINEVWIKKFWVKVVQQALKDTVEWMWNIISFKWLRELKWVNIINKYTFWKVSEATKPARIKLFEKMEKAWIVKEWATQRAKMAWTIEEIKLIQHETLKEAWKDKTIKDDIEYTKVESTKNLDNILSQVQKMSENWEIDQAEYKFVLELLQKQDKTIWNAMDSVKKVTLEIDALNSWEKSVQDTILSIKEVLEKNKWKISDWLMQYYERIIQKLENWESFWKDSWNYLLLLNKFNWQVSVAAYSNNEKALSEYYNLIKNGESESRYWYGGNYLRTMDSLKSIIESNSFNPKNAPELIKTYMTLIKNAETSGWWTIRTELIDWKITEKINSWEIDNWYEYNVKKLLEQESIKDNIHLIINNIDFSMIRSEKIIKDIANIALENVKILEEKWETKKAIDIIWNLSKKEEISIFLKSYFKDFENQALLISLESETDSSVALLKLLPYLENSSKTINRILLNLKDNDQISKDIWLNKKYENYKWEEAVPFTRSDLDNTLRELQKLNDNDYRKALVLIIEKVTWKTIIKWNLTWKEKIDDKTLKQFSKYIEWYDIAARFVKVYPSQFENISKAIISEKTSIAYQIKYLVELEKLDLDYITYKKQLKETLIELTEGILDSTKRKINNKKYDQIIRQLDNIENYFSKDSNLESQDLLVIVEELKKSKKYKKQQEWLNKTLVLLLDLDRTHNKEFLREQKTSWNITYKTKALIDTYIKYWAILSDDWKIIKSLTPDEISRLKVVKEQVSEVLANHFERNLFNPEKYKDKNTNKAEYIYEILNQKTWWDLDNLSNDNTIRNIAKQLNSITNNFNIKPKVINKVLEKILSNTTSLDIQQKIKLLKVLERAWVIKPSPEQKLDYIISLKPKDSNDFRDWAKYLKEYSKHFDTHLKEWNQKVIEIKLIFDKNPTEWKIQMEKYIKGILDTKTPVSFESIKNKWDDFIEWRDWVKIDWKYYITEVYPSRYFIKQLISWNLDIRQKEAYMEMIHNKTEFGWKSFKEYFSEVTDIETKLLMSYHDDIKYDKEVLDLLKKYAADPKYNATVAYVLSKRNDFELIKWHEWLDLQRWVIKKIVTKDYLEEKIWKKLNEEKYDELLWQIERIIIAMKTIGYAEASSRDLESIIPNTENVIKEIKAIYENKISFIEELLKDNNIQHIISSARALDENNQNTAKVLNKHTSSLWKTNAALVWLNIKTSINSNNILKKNERLETLKLAKDFLQNNKKLLFIPLIWKLIMDPTEAAAAEAKIADTWEKSPKYPEYLKAMEAWDITAAMKIKKEAINQITKMVLKDYIADFKDKYEARYLSKFQAFPLWLRDLTATIHEKLSPMVKDKTVKWRNAFAQSIYNFINHYNKEDWKAEKYARKLLDKVEWGQSSPIADLIINMWKQSDIEATKSPEQKQREYDEYMKQLRRNIDASQRNIDKWNEIIDRMKSL